MARPESAPTRRQWRWKKPRVEQQQHHRLRSHALLGQGKVAKVYLCTIDEDNTANKTTPKYYAVKVIPKAAIKAAGPTMKRQHRTEIQIHRRLGHHPHICRFHQYYEDANHCFLLLDAANPQTTISLATLLQRRHRLTEPEVAVYVRHIVQALHYLHDTHGVVHRNVQLSNLLLDQQHRTVQLTDFGMAAMTANSPFMLQEDDMEYIAPELLCCATRDGGGTTATPSMDVWSLGVCVYTMLVGTTPFGGEDDVRDKYRRIIENNYRFPDEDGEVVMLSETAKDFVWSMLQTNPQDRLTLDEIDAHPFLDRRNVPQTLQPFWQRNVQGLLAASRTPPRRHPSEKPKEPVFNDADPFAAWSCAGFKQMSEDDLQTHWDCLQHSKGASPAPQPVVAPTQWVTRYFTSKFGLAFLFNNGHMGMCFLDGTQGIVEPTKLSVDYIMEDGRMTRYSLSDYPKSLREKVHMLQQFVATISSNDETAIRSATDNSTPVGDICYLQKYARTKDAIVFILSDGSVQTFFTDQVEMILTPTAAGCCGVPAGARDGQAPSCHPSTMTNHITYLRHCLAKMSAMEEEDSLVDSVEDLCFPELSPGGGVQIIPEIEVKDSIGGTTVGNRSLFECLPLLSPQQDNLQPQRSTERASSPNSKVLIDAVSANGGSSAELKFGKDETDSVALQVASLEECKPSEEDLVTEDDTTGAGSNLLPIEPIGEAGSVCTTEAFTSVELGQSSEGNETMKDEQDRTSDETETCSDRTMGRSPLMECSDTGTRNIPITTGTVGTEDASFQSVALLTQENENAHPRVPDEIQTCENSLRLVARECSKRSDEESNPDNDIQSTMATGIVEPTEISIASCCVSSQGSSQQFRVNDESQSLPEDEDNFCGAETLGSNECAMRKAPLGGKDSGCSSDQLGSKTAFSASPTSVARTISTSFDEELELFDDNERSERLSTGKRGHPVMLTDCPLRSTIEQGVKGVAVDGMALLSKPEQKHPSGVEQPPSPTADGLETAWSLAERSLAFDTLASHGQPSDCLGIAQTDVSVEPAGPLAINNKEIVTPTTAGKISSSDSSASPMLPDKVGSVNGSKVPTTVTVHSDDTLTTDERNENHQELVTVLCNHWRDVAECAMDGMRSAESVIIAMKSQRQEEELLRCQLEGEVHRLREEQEASRLQLEELVRSNETKQDAIDAYEREVEMLRNQLSAFQARCDSMERSLDISMEGESSLRYRTEDNVIPCLTPQGLSSSVPCIQVTNLLLSEEFHQKTIRSGHEHEAPHDKEIPVVTPLKVSAEANDETIVELDQEHEARNDEEIPVVTPPHPKVSEEASDEKIVESTHEHETPNDQEIPVVTPQPKVQWEEIMINLRSRCQLLESEREEIIHSSLDMLAATKEACKAELEAAIATARREAVEEYIQKSTGG